MSMIPGVTNLPVPSITRAGRGGEVGPADAWITAVGKKTVPLSIRPPSPSKMVAPRIDVGAPG